MFFGGFPNLLKIIRLVGRDLKNAVVTQGAVNGVEKIRANNPAPMMTPFWPGIGKQ
jgi:hypothetical protein